MKRFLLAVPLALALLGAAAPNASAQLDIYVRVYGIEGSSQDAKHPNWIEGLSLRQTLGPNREVRNGCAVEIVKELDAAGPQLWAAAVRGDLIRDVRIELVRKGHNGPKVYEIWLRFVRIPSISTEADSAFVERVIFQGELVELTYWPLGPAGTPGAPVRTQWDCSGELPGPGLPESR